MLVYRLQYARNLAALRICRASMSPEKYAAAWPVTGSRHAVVRLRTALASVCVS